MMLRGDNREILKRSRKTRFWDRLQRDTSGGIIVEFAYSIPILVMLLYFSLDIPNAYRFVEKMHKTSELYAQMLVNTARCKLAKGNEQLTSGDFEEILKGIALTFYGVNTKQTQFPFFLRVHLVLIRGIGDDKFSQVGRANVTINLTSLTIIQPAPNNLSEHSSLESNAEEHGGSLQNLEIRSGEMKLLVETVAYYDESSSTARGFNSAFHLLRLGRLLSSSMYRVLKDKIAIVTLPSGVVLPLS
jgi:hypothetical protein